MSLRMQAVRLDADDPDAAGTFWAGLLGRSVVRERAGVLLPGDPRQVGLRFVAATSARPERGPFHLHVTSSTPDDQEAILRTALRLGGRRRGAKPLPIGRDLYLSDADGNDFCLIEPGDAYLAGCGPLGEVTCEGLREAGLFWSEALRWSIVWDQGDQVAIQSPEGGTKIAWDRPENDGDVAWNRRWFDLVASDVSAEIDRLTALGATPLGDRGGVTVMTDPGGVEFSVAATS